MKSINYLLSRQIFSLAPIAIFIRILSQRTWIPQPFVMRLLAI